MTYRLRNITIAIALALVAALLTSFYVTNYQRNVRKDETNVQVFVAKVDIPAGLSGADVASRGMMTKSEVVRRGVVPGAISNPAQLATLVATEPIYAGEQVSTRRFATPSEQGILAQLTGVQRGIALPGDSDQLLVGTLKTGDRVDVVASWTYPEGTQTHYSKVVLRNILVLKAPDANGTAEKVTSAGVSPYSAIVAVTDLQIQKLEWTKVNADWHLALRPGIDAADSPENVESAHSLLTEGVKAKQLEDARVGKAPVEGSQ
ncbi:MAG: pilus assembly protein CpaB [Gaiellaceae bacterium]|jgi:Flp pilus assembly protein CpaB|nr:pilus assembly protein CpaB [Gaiellaceae bacterium]